MPCWVKKWVWDMARQVDIGGRHVLNIQTGYILMVRVASVERQ